MGEAILSGIAGGRVLTVTDSNVHDNRRTAYNQVCTSFHAIDDLRTKLLGFLPLVTGGGLILLTGRTGEVRKEFFGPLGLFGILATFGLLAYELNGMKRCVELIYDGAALEQAMALGHGQFITRVEHPSSLLTKPFAPPNMFTKPFAAAWIYPAVLAAWTYLGLFLYHRALATMTSLNVFVAGLVGVLWYDQSWSKKLCDRYNCKKSTQGIEIGRTAHSDEQSGKPAPAPPEIGRTPV